MAPRMVCHSAADVMKMSTGRIRIQLEDLAPADFNRNGEPLSAKQVLHLAERILTDQGFAEYRYTSGWCHTPPENDPECVWRHASVLNRDDPQLPRYPRKALYGVFRKNHLIAFLQKLKQGNIVLPGSGGVPFEVPANSPDWAELRKVLDQGILMDVFLYNDVQARKEDFIALMASDNFDQAFSLRDDEFTLMRRLSALMRGAKVLAPSSPEWKEAVRSQRQLCGGRWSDRELQGMYNFAVTTDEAKLNFLTVVARFLVDSSRFRIPSWFWVKAAKISPRQQGIRLLLTARMLASEELNPPEVQAAGTD